MSGMTSGLGAGMQTQVGDPPGGGLGSADDGAPQGKLTGPHSQSERQKKLIKEVKKRYERASKWESTFRARFIDDLKFDAADAYNNYQWPNSVRRLRDIDDRPCLTINKTAQHNLQVINDGKQNKPEVRVRPVGGEATYESAQCYEGLMRHIQYQSEFSTIHDQASAFQIRAGFGVYRVATDYAGDDSMDQEIFIRPIVDPLSVMFDPDAKASDKSDGRWALLFDNIDKEEFKEIYPEYKDFTPSRDISVSQSDDWIGENHVRICEYFYKAQKEHRVIRFTDPDTGDVRQVPVNEVPEDLLDRVLDAPSTRQRTVVLNEVRHCVIVGDCIAEENVWPGRYIPLIPVIGQESVIDGIMDRKGHTRALIDPQRMYNYWASAAVEFGALQTKSPWVAPAAAIEGHEQKWNVANKQNASVLPYNHMDDEGNEIPAPVRPQPPEQAPLYLSGMQTTQMEMMMVSGQYQSQMGQQGNERSGKAIQERQRQGDNATYHFIDNQAIAIRLLGKILLDLIPKVYSTPRVLQILAQDGKTSIPVKIDPQAAQGYIQELGQDQQIAKRIFNPNVGKYDVLADIGPAYASRREEAFNAMTQIMTQAPETTALIGDILFKNADFPGAEEAAQRLERMVPAQAKGQGPSQAEQQLSQELQKVQGVNTTLMSELAKMKLQLTGKQEMRDIDSYKAESERLGVLAKNGIMEPEGFGVLVKQLVEDALQTHILRAQASAQASDGAPALPGTAGGVMPPSMLPGSPGPGPGGLPQ